MTDLCKKGREVHGLMIRKAILEDIPAIAEIYDEIHTEEEAGPVSIGWVREIYPTRETAEAALNSGDLYVLEDGGKVVAAGRLNQRQEPSYAEAGWEYDAKEEEVMVLHTLVVSPKGENRGYGKAFVLFYEDFAIKRGCKYLRMDTNEKNRRARKFYSKMVYKEVGIVPCEFNGIRGVQLVCLEKKL